MFEETFQSDLDLAQPILQDLPKDIIFPSELNKYLKDKLHELTYENGRLKQNICEYEIRARSGDEKFATLQRKLEKLEGNGSNFPQNLARAKIVELSKKLREKNAELESAKSKFAKLEQEIFKKEKEHETKEETKEIENTKPVDTLQMEVKALQEKLACANSKLFDEKNSNLSLKNDLKLANKMLQLEVGDGFESSVQLFQSGNWKGRSQIILELQKKNGEMREKLKQFQEGSKNLEGSSQQRKSFLENRLEKVSADFARVSEENAELKKKLQYQLHRNKTVETDSSYWKSKFTKLNEDFAQQKNEMLKQAAYEEDKCKEHVKLLKQKLAEIEEIRKALKNSEQNLLKEKCKVENLEKLVTKQPENIEFENPDSTNTSPTKSEKFQENEKLVSRLEAEKLRLVELTTLFNTRLNTERLAKDNLENLYKQERRKAAQLEAKLARLQLEDTSDRSSSYSARFHNSHETNFEYKYQIAEEQIKALQTKLSIEKQERELDLAEFTKIIKNQSFNPN